MELRNAEVPSPNDSQNKTGAMFEDCLGSDNTFPYRLSGVANNGGSLFASRDEMS